MKKVCCFGELLLRISPALNRQWISDAHAAIYIGGAELNVATALSNWQVSVRYCTALPDSYLSTDIMAELDSRQIDTSAVVFSGNRIGTYYLPQGADLKNAGVIYDRAGSAFADLKPGTINWAEVLKDCHWFHFSAICPALNYEVALVCKEALEAATQLGLTISVDLNYRAKLWQYGKQPADVMKELLPFCHVVMGNVWSAGQLLNIDCSLETSDGYSDEELISAAQQSIAQLQQAYPNAKTVAFTFRLPQNYFAVLQHNHALTVSKNFLLQNIVDKVGTGDCFMAGLIYGLQNASAPQALIDFAAAAAAGKMFEKSDTTRQTIKQVTQRMMNQVDTPSDIVSRLKVQKMLPLFYHANAGVCLSVIKALYAAGVRLIEFTNRGEAALQNFTAIAAERNESMKDLLLAAGTIKTAKDAHAFIDAGADFLISPVFDKEVCQAAAGRQTLWLPGCMTPTEIHQAEQAGCKVIKLFPGNLLQPGFVSSIKELFPGVDFIPTGGVEAEQANLQAWFNAGVCAVGMGSKLISKKLLDAKDYPAIEADTRKALELLNNLSH